MAVEPPAFVVWLAVTVFLRMVYTLERENMVVEELSGYTYGYYGEYSL